MRVLANTYGWSSSAACGRAVGTVNTSLLVPPVDEQVSGALREPRQGDQLDEAGDGVTGEEILPTRLAAQNLSVV